ncbi:hypothetical protein T484DRAFT_1754573 [Baffinella frigidus]|nr:hypothetical protein T484DRAFT_1754573 [Cryptophyta sp. CCMP2293]
MSSIFMFRELTRLYVHYSTYYEPLLAISYNTLDDTRTSATFTKALDKIAEECDGLMQDIQATDLKGLHRVIKYIKAMKLVESYPFDIFESSTSAAFQSITKAPNTPLYQARNLFEWPACISGTPDIIVNLYFEKMLMQKNPVRIFDTMVRLDGNKNRETKVTNAWNCSVDIPGKAYNYYVATMEVPMGKLILDELYNKVSTHLDVVQTRVREQLRPILYANDMTFNHVRNVKMSPIVQVLSSQLELGSGMYQFLCISKNTGKVLIVTLHLNWSEQTDLHILDIFNDVNTLMDEKIDIQLDSKTPVMYHVQPSTEGIQPFQVSYKDAPATIIAALSATPRNPAYIPKTVIAHLTEPIGSKSIRQKASDIQSIRAESLRIMHQLGGGTQHKSHGFEYLNPPRHISTERSSDVSSNSDYESFSDSDLLPTGEIMDEPARPWEDNPGSDVHGERVRNTGSRFQVTGMWAMSTNVYVIKRNAMQREKVANGGPENGTDAAK